jgi:excisionase family DNA binding protein
MPRADTERDEHESKTPERLVLTVPEAGRLVGLGRASAYQAARSGELPTLRFGRRVVVPRAALDRLLSGGSE